MTEWKFENGLDRITAAANPRQIERVPRGSIFNFEIIYTVEYEGEKDNADQQEQAIKDAQDDLTSILKALWILEDDALGGHGSRGYGKVRFSELNFLYKDYQNLGNGSVLQLPETRQRSVTETNKLSESFDDIKKLFSASQS
jgi:CRISPR-associated protein Csm3